MAFIDALGTENATRFFGRLLAVITPPAPLRLVMPKNTRER